MALAITGLTDAEIASLSSSPRIQRWLRDLITQLRTLDATLSTSVTDLSDVTGVADDGLAASRVAMSVAVSLARLVSDLEHRPREINYKMPAEYTIEYARSKADIGLQKVENTALSTWPGTANLITLGTISTGVWQGTVIGTAYGGTGLSALGAGVQTWLETPSSANLAAATTDETGTGSLVFANTPTLVTPVIGAATGTSVNLSSTATASALIPTGSAIPANGVYLPAPNSVAIATDGTERIRADAAGNIGTGGATVPTVGATQVLGVGNTSGGTLACLQSNAITFRISATTGGVDVFGPNNVPTIFYTNAIDRLHLSETGQLEMQTVGKGVSIKEGSNAKQGTATLVAGAVTVSNTAVTANSRIFLTSQADGGTPGFLRVSARTPATSFTITSSDAADTSTVAYEIFEPS